MYAQLQDMYLKYKDRGFVVLGFPCNQFGKQEPGTNDEILKFAQEKYQVTFPLFSKTNVNGKDAEPLFLFLRSRLPGVLGTSIKWNFTKFLTDRNGKPVKRYSPTARPESFENDVVQELDRTMKFSSRSLTKKESSSLAKTGNTTSEKSS